MVRKGWKSLRRAGSLVTFAAFFGVAINGAALAGGEDTLAQSAPTTNGTVSGTVLTSDGAPVPGASVVLQGPARQTSSTDARGAFRFDSVAPGVYIITVSKAGFTAARQENVGVTAGSTATLSIPLVASSFSSLRQIGRTSTSVPGRAQINTSTAALAVVSNQTFVDQGQQQVTKILNETPGIVASRSTGGNSASQASPVIPQIRGALPYETETLVDGHPVSVGAYGFFSPLYLNPALLQDVEIAKGPGVLGTDINYAIGGSVNYRTLEPTREFHSVVDLGIDNYGGTSPSVRITGSTPSHVVDYAFAYAASGTPGPLQNYSVAGSQVPLVYGSAPYFVNGRGYGGFPEGAAASKTPQYAGVPGQAYFAQPIYVCCSVLNTQYYNRDELAKLRFNISQQTALTISYLGAQSTNDQTGVAQANSVSPLPPGINFSSFAPPPGYTGSIPAGAAIPFDLGAFNPLNNSVQQSLLQSELRSAIGKTTVLARYYAGAANDFQFNSHGALNESFSGNAWGGVPLCGVGVAFNLATSACADGAAPTPTFFNGQPTTFTSGAAQATLLTQDHLRGYSLELDEPLNDDLFTLAFDRSHHDSINYEYSPLNGLIGYQLAPGSGQQFTTILARAQLALTPRFTTTISNYAIQYASHYSGDGGTTYQDSTRAFDAPRVAFSWRPNVDVAWRFALGSSIAPPYISLLSAPAQVPQPNSVPATYFNLNTNNGDIKPETAFGYDLGFDKRIARSISLSTDVYLTNLHDMFLPSTFQQGTFSSTASNGAALPLFINQTRNIAFARYEGIEVALQNAPVAGWGFKLQGTLQRGYPYDLPAGFYNTAAGPYTTNLAVISGANFQPSGLGFNGVGGAGASVGRVPYSTGYGELNYRTPSGFYGNLGITYFGSNNSYNRQAFGVVSGTIRVPLSHDISLQFAGDNLTGAYDKGYYGEFDGVAIPLVNGGHTNTGYLGTTDGGTYGPATLRASIRYEFGKR